MVASPATRKITRSMIGWIGGMVDESLSQRSTRFLELAVGACGKTGGFACMAETAMPRKKAVASFFQSSCDPFAIRSPHCSRRYTIKRC